MIDVIQPERVKFTIRGLCGKDSHPSVRKPPLQAMQLQQQIQSLTRLQAKEREAENMQLCHVLLSFANAVTLCG